MSERSRLQIYICLHHQHLIECAVCILEPESIRSETSKSVAHQMNKHIKGNINQLCEM